MAREQKKKTSDQLHRIAKEAAKELIRKSGGIDGAAGSCRLSRSQIAATANRDDTSRYLPLDVLLTLEEAVEAPIATAFLARKRNYLLIKIPAVDSDSIWQKHFNKTVSKTSRAFRHVVSALEDGTITASEAENLIEQVDSVLHAFSSLRSALVKVRSERQPKLKLLKAG